MRYDLSNGMILFYVEHRYRAIHIPIFQCEILYQYVSLTNPPANVVILNSGNSIMYSRTSSDIREIIDFYNSLCIKIGDRIDPLSVPVQVVLTTFVPDATVKPVDGVD
jgi:hypothetical protein